MSLKKYLLAGGLSTMLLLGACGLGDGEEEEGSSEEESSEETEDTESEDFGDDSDSEDDSADSGDDTDSEDDSADSGDDSDGEDSVDVDSDEDNSSIGIGGTEDLDEEDVDEEASDESEDATSGEEQTKTFALEENGTYNELVYYYVGDEVKRQTSVTEMDYEAIGASNEEEAKELLADASQEYTDTDGVDHNIEYNEDGFVETTEVNYDEADLNEVAGLDGADFEGEESAEFVSMERSEEQLLNAGYELVEGEAVSDADSGSDSESSSGESSAGGIDFSTITGETLTGDDTEITSMFIGNSGIAELLGNAEESDADIEEVLKPSEEISTYFAETYMAIHAFGAGSDTPAESDVAGLSAEIDERDGFEVFSQVYDKESGKLLPNIYANPDQFAAFDGTGWVDQTGTAESDEVFYGSYSNLHEAFMENSDVIDVSEDDDYYFLHNIGDEESLHETFGSIFNVEYTGANTDEMENAVVGIVEKSSGDLVHVAYISTAPGQQNPEETLHIEIAEQIDKYGEYDDGGVTVPDVQENPAPDTETEESGSGSEEESSGSTQDGLTVGDSAELNGMTLTVEDVSYTDERNEFAEVEADEVIMLELSFENNSGDSYLMGSRDMEVMLDGEPAETYPVGDIILDETADGESATGTLAYAVTGDPSEIELVFSPLDAEDSAVFNVTPE
ncbi:YehR family lipoprotein [Salinicoccus sp. Marseille-QA3877]